MGIMQKALETYEANRDLVGVVRDDHEVLAPIYHIITCAALEITVNAKGEFVTACKVGKNEPKFVIPVTESSAGRSSGACAHPLCDKIIYISPFDAEKHKLYLEQLEDWTNSEYSHPMLKAILEYVKGGSIIQDLMKLSLIKSEELTKDEGGMLVRWRVNGIGAESGPCWTNKALFEAYSKWYISKNENEEKNLCMISGEYTQIARLHARGVVAMKGKAKIISSNDNDNFTYLGRFTDASQAATIGTAASQKAHNTLHWLVTEQGASEVYGGRTFICWNPERKKICHPTGPFGMLDSKNSSLTDYKRELKRILEGYKAEFAGDQEGVVTAALDAATQGRLAITYYSEMTGDDFFERLYNWDLTCCWNNGSYGVQPPLLRNIINCAYGTVRKEWLETDDSIMAQQMQGLLSCRLDGAKIPKGLVKRLADRASNPQAYDDKIWYRILFTACAVINKYQNDYKEENAMAWSLDKHDRSFQFGRLLAVMDRAEKDYYSKTGEDRQTNAIKSMSVFRQRPWSTYERVNRQLQQAYIGRLEQCSKIRYSKLTEEIVNIIKDFPENELNRPLDDTYLLGYDMQRNEFFKSNKENETEEK